mgnify:CR=1 FL=1
MSYILNTPSQIEKMLEEIGLISLEELFKHIPQKIKVKELNNLEERKSELDVLSTIDKIAKKNKGTNKFNSFLGAGLYEHYIPSALKHLLYRTEFYTAYTPYQPECSQGILQALYEYQSFICLLTGMEVTNASLYDGATAMVEAVLMSLRINKRNKIIVTKSVHPEYREVLYTYLRLQPYHIIELPYKNDGLIDKEALLNIIEEDTSCIIIQSPNFFGLIENIEEVKRSIKDKNIILIDVVNPITLAILKEPKEMGVDIVCGEGQSLGGNLSFGGPSFGFLATKKEYVRQLPGRIVGKTEDVEGNPAFCLTLQTREQHIRREKATSNICSNESLNAIGAAIYLALLGKEGFKKASLYSLNNTYYLLTKLRDIKKVSFPFKGLVFNEFVWKIENAHKILQQLEEKNILGGVALDKFYPELSDCILTSCTEKKTKKDIEDFIWNLKKIIK